MFRYLKTIASIAVWCSFSSAGWTADVLTSAAPQPGKVKNILLIMSDDLKASALPAYGNTVCKTPNLDRLAASGMVFERAYCQGLACSPSRPSIMRSIYPRSKATAPTIGEHLQTFGMHTARVGKIFHMPVPHAQLDGSNGKDVAACWTERYNTKSAETFSPGLYRLLNQGIVTREIEGRDAKGPNRMFATVESDREDGSDQADYMAATKTIERDPTATVRDTALSVHMRPGGAIRSSTWHYMKYGEKGEELYDMVKDPHQYTNVLNDRAYADVLKEARATFQKRMADAR